MIGRQEEATICRELLKSRKSELLLVTGRRRVGKTYMIKQIFSDYIIFDFIGTKDATLENQLEKFSTQINNYFTKKNISHQFDSWFTALNELSLCIEKSRRSKKKYVIFFDELPWMAVDKSNFIGELEYWWNNWGVNQSNLVFIVSGSATSWMMKNLRDNVDGFHNRITRMIHLEPFTLRETQQFLISRGMHLDEYHIAQLYMCIGGIPFYLEGIRRGDSFSQTINFLFFSKNGLLVNEFDNLYHALFKQADNYIAVVRALATKWKGLTRNEIAKIAKLHNGGGLTVILENLIKCSFIIEIPAIDKLTKDKSYRLVDEYTIFYFTYVEGKKSASKDIWLYKTKLPVYSSWQGYAFENLCIRHSEAIKIALGISGIETYIASFNYRGTKHKTGLQIDMLIDRADRSINLCEMKFHDKEMVINKTFSNSLRLKRALFGELYKKRKQLINTLITTYGIDTNLSMHSEIDKVVTLSDLYLLKSF